MTGLQVFTLIVLMILASALLFFDYRQTLTIARMPSVFRERNPVCRFFMMRGGTTDQRMAGVSCYFTLFSMALFALVTGLALFDHAVAACVILFLLCAAELYCLVNNYILGIEPYFGEEV